MILEDATYEAFGYYSTDFKPHSSMLIIAACEACGRFRILRKCDYCTFCKSCFKKGRKFSEEHKQKICEALKGKSCGVKSPNWQGGISFEPYCIQFNNTYKVKIRDRFGNKCFLCGKSQKENGKALDVHHVNYNKKCGCDDTKCICVPLCRSCHSKTNCNREYWKSFIMNKLKETMWGWI